MHELAHVPEPNRELVLEAMGAVLAAFDPWRLDAAAADDDDDVIPHSPMLDFGDEDMAWYDFLEFRRVEYLTSEPWGNDPAMRFAADGEVLAVAEKTGDALTDGLRDRHPSQFTLSRLCGLVADVALARAALGRASIFWEQVLDRLQRGLIPVRWVGEWPAGRVVCIRP